VRRRTSGRTDEDAFDVAQNAEVAAGAERYYRIMMRGDRESSSQELTNYVPTRIGARYDALVWFEQTVALHALHHEDRPIEPELETEPTGF